jgi:hypothetical protein
MKRIKKIGVLRTSITMTVVSLLFVIISVIPAVHIYDDVLNWDRIGPSEEQFAVLYILSMPIVIFISTALSCLLYNLASKWTGGIEIYFEENDN